MTRCTGKCEQIGRHYCNALPSSSPHEWDGGEEKMNCTSHFCCMCDEHLEERREIFMTKTNYYPE